MKDFKALIYCKNSLNLNAIQKLTPVLEKSIPNHLEELQFIDTKMDATLIEALMDSLVET